MFTVRGALIKAGRADLIGACEGLFPANPPKAAIEARRRPTNLPKATMTPYHTVANPAKGERLGERGLPSQGYRPGRKSARREDKKRKRKTGGSDPRP